MGRLTNVDLFVAACAIVVAGSLLFTLAGCAEGERPALISKAEAMVVDQSPAAARPYQRTVMREGRAAWGLDAPLPAMGAQIEAESGWRPDAVSGVGARGMAQFMPATAEWIARTYPELGAADPANPQWAIRAMARYDKHLFDRMAGNDECERYAFALAGYNGGPGWVARDQAAAAARGIDPGRYFGAVESINAGRRADAFRENRTYVPRILRDYQPRYATWGRYLCGGLA